MLKGTNIVLGVSGGIAAYKACDIVSKLRKLDANVNVIMTVAAMEFIKPHTFQALSQNPVITEMFESPRYWEIEHISLAQKADVLLIAPATANIIGKVANGIADDMLSTTIMASTAKVIFAPAMNTKMYENPILQENINKLKGLGYEFIPPGSGRLACGDHGAGKLADVEAVVKYIVDIEKKNQDQDLAGKRVLVTAGPTCESIDPIRYITNHSSGKMGYSIAEAAQKRGATVVLVSGPTHIEPPLNVEVIQIKSALEMYEAVLRQYENQDMVIKAAAVGDYRPALKADQKIKKSDDELVIQMVKNPDILLELGKRKKQQVLVGFAAETMNMLSYAKGKLEKKNLDLIVANNVTENGAGFGGDTNIVYLINRSGKTIKIEKSSKLEIAHQILNEAKTYL
ncbi:phosphopantothenoylcysteine decarboxylase/phosphopantothenate--cysteine ligase [Alkaliphilus metalliredigens QYMF]|uniref:Coenzyme A biosynthesis bifunctional protein CoaBC n=1 Tax=Alkaliphilus metalliredigens (strain QYMF) TaxID=293826 RepID=A6TRX0_ALKMQ|nr:bifunctional phosphopantothenoylcysteine decarboxylase/phosphopantothenate--cysteine ligase CoaBC [Alkaliphilus metalliredigens]ABR48938.1 phosphopantothenoylcysteine decarboxylase/phosphopantothenate--cysteine ligase [Alkaliphilus metalliredigens QYMF]